MKVFISWSGERSKRVAELFKEWLPCVIQATKPWISTHDIQGGSLWFNEINTQLSETSVGIICLTAENKDKPWILFEAGALAKGLTTSRVIPFLIDIKPKDVENPLAQLNLVNYSKDNLFKLIKDINVNLLESIDDKTLDKIFNTNWPEFNLEFEKIINETPLKQAQEKRDDSDILNEVLLLVREISKKSNNDPAPRTPDRYRLVFTTKRHHIKDIEELIKPLHTTSKYIKNITRDHSEIGILAFDRLVLDIIINKMDELGIPLIDLSIKSVYG